MSNKRLASLTYLKGAHKPHILQIWKFGSPIKTFRFITESAARDYAELNGYQIVEQKEAMQQPRLVKQTKAAA